VDLQQVERGQDLIHVACNRDSWRHPVNAVMKNLVPKYVGNSLNS
jgi:hypothetical protein